MQSNTPVTLESLAATLESVVHRLNSIDARLDKLEQDVKDLKVETTAYQKGLDGMVRMANTIIITTGTVVVLGNLIPSILNFVAQTAQLSAR